MTNDRVMISCKDTMFVDFRDVATRRPTHVVEIFTLFCEGRRLVCALVITRLKAFMVLAIIRRVYFAIGTVFMDAILAL